MRLCTRVLLSAVLACALLIPVTAEEAHASDQPRIVKVGYTDSEGLLTKNDDGTYEGYTYDYLMRIAQFTGWSFEFVEAEGDNANERALRLLEMLDNGEVDIEGSMSYSAALAETYEYPENSYGSAHTALFAPNIHAAVSKTDLFTRSELRVAILATAKKRRAELEYYCDQNDIRLTTVECSSSQEMRDRTNAGEAWAEGRYAVCFPGAASTSSSSTRPRIFLTLRPSMPPSFGRFFGPKMISTTTRISMSSGMPIPNIFIVRSFRASSRSVPSIIATLNL